MCVGRLGGTNFINNESDETVARCECVAAPLATEAGYDFASMPATIYAGPCIIYGFSMYMYWSTPLQG